MKIQELQNWCYRLEKHTGEREAIFLLAKLTEELGEFTKKLLELEGHRQINPEQDTLGKELFDMLYNMLTIAAIHNIDILQEFKTAIAKYEARFNAVNFWEDRNADATLG